MATLSINDSREYVIFQAFAKHDKFKDALADLERYDKENPKSRIFDTADDKKAMRQSFDVFKCAERVVSRNGKVDYDDPVMVERLRTIITQKILPVRAVVINENAQGIATRRANIGCIMYYYSRYCQKIDSRDKQRWTREAGKVKHDVVTTGKSGIVKRGGYGGGSVFSTKSGEYKTNWQKLYDK